MKEQEVNIETVYSGLQKPISEILHPHIEDQRFKDLPELKAVLALFWWENKRGHRLCYACLYLFP